MMMAALYGHMAQLVVDRLVCGCRDCFDWIRQQYRMRVARY